MILRWLERILLGIFLLALAVVTSLSALVSTEAGSIWAIRKAVGLIPASVGQLELGKLDGNLLTGLDVAYVDFSQRREGVVAQHYRAENLSFRWQPLALFYRSVAVESLQADHILIALPPPGDTPTDKPFTWPDISLPVTIELGDVALNDIHVRQGEKSLVDIISVTGSAGMGAFNVRFDELAVTTARYGVAASGRIGVRYPYAADVSASWYLTLPEPENSQAEPVRFSGAGELRGDIKHIRINHELQEPFAIASKGFFEPRLSPESTEKKADPYVELTNTWQEQTPLARWFPANLPRPVSTAELKVSGWYDAYHALLDGHVVQPQLAEFDVQADVSGNLSRIDIASLTIARQEKNKDAVAVELTTQGEVVWAPQVSWNLALNTNELNPANYIADWPGNIALDALIKGSFAAAPGSVNKQLQLEVSELTLAGTLRDLNVSGKGGFSFDGKRWQSDQLQVSMGANQIDLAGSYSDRLDAQWTINAPLLGQIDPRISGNLSSSGKIRGTFAAPEIAVEATGQNLRWEKYTLQNLQLSLQRNSGEYQLSLAARDLQLNAHHLPRIALNGTGRMAQHQLHGELEDEDLGQLEFDLQSRYQNAQWDGKFASLRLSLKGMPQLVATSGEWIHLEAGSAEIGNQCFTVRNRRQRPESENVNADSSASSGEQSDSATAMKPSSETQAITSGPSGDGIRTSDDVVRVAARPRAASEGETPQICFHGKWRSGKEALAEASLKALPLRFARPWLKPDVSLSGVIDGQAEFRWDQTKKGASAYAGLSGSAQLHTRDGALHYQFAEEDPSDYEWQSATLSASLKQNLLDTDLLMDWGQYGKIDATAQVNLEDQNITAELNANMGDLSPLEAIIPLVDDVEGRFAADVSLRGKLPNPDIIGNVHLRNGAAKIPRLGLELKDIGLTLRSQSGGHMDLQAALKSGEGTLQINADVNKLGTPEWLLKGDLRGENFQLINQSQLVANITPAIDLRVDANEIHLTGDAKIPYARSSIKALPPSAIKVSKDVVVINDQRSNETAVAGKPLFINMTLSLGNDVHFSGFGLDGKLTGKINVVQTPPRSLLTTGYVSVENGTYKAYGQELKIERGRLLFQGPYDNPGLDIRATRETEEYKVGLEIGGTIQQPNSSVITDEDLSESESMAILLTGKPLSEASAGDAYMLLSAVSGLGVDKGPAITEEIAQAFHVDELTINAEDGFKQSELWVGKYLSPKLFVRYMVGLFDEASSFGLTYQLTDKLRVEAESGEAQSVDIIYKIER